MTTLWDRKHLTSLGAATEARKDGYEVYNTSTDEDGNTVYHVQRPAAPDAASPDAAAPDAAAPDAGNEPRTSGGISSGPITMPSIETTAAEPAPEPQLVGAVGTRSASALAQAGVTTLSDALAMSRERLSTLAGIGPATLDKLDSLR